MKRVRGQVSVFVILALVLVFVILIIFLVNQKILDVSVLTINSEVRPIYSFVQQCVEKTSEDAVQYIGENGGYYIPLNNSLDNGIPIYFDKGEVMVPSKEQIELELSKYIDEMLFFCVRNFVDFPDFNVEQGEVMTDTMIENGKVVFDVDYGLSISKGEKSYSFRDFDSEVDVRLDVLYSVIYEIVNEHMTEQDICISCIDDLLEENSLYIDMSDHNNETVLFAIIDEEFEINNEEYWFYFAGKYVV